MMVTSWLPLLTIASITFRATSMTISVGTRFELRLEYNTQGYLLPVPPTTATLPILDQD